MQGAQYESCCMFVSLNDDAFHDAAGTLTQHVAIVVCMFAKWAARGSRNWHAWLVWSALLPGLVHVPCLVKSGQDHLTSDGLRQSESSPEAKADFVQMGHDSLPVILILTWIGKPSCTRAANMVLQRTTQVGCKHVWCQAGIGKRLHVHGHEQGRIRGRRATLENAFGGWSFCGETGLQAWLGVSELQPMIVVFLSH